MFRTFNTFYLLLVAVCFMSQQTLACNCVMPLPAYDQKTLEQIDIAGHFEVTEVTMPDNWSGDAPAFSEITLRVIDLYKGKSSAEHIIVYSDMKDGCARYVEGGTSKNLLLYDKGDRYFLADQCTDLSEEGWKHLAEKAQPALILDSPLKMFSAQEVQGFFATFESNDFTIDARTFLDWKRNDPLILDLRSAETYSHSHIEGAIHIGADITEKKIAQYAPDKNTRILLYCDNSLIPLRKISLTHLTLPQFHMLGYTNTYMLGPVWQKDGQIIEASEILPMTKPDENSE